MTGQSSRPARRSRAIEDHRPLPKRRKIRKGTTSCWECKRRKTRCHFSSPTSEVCVGCQQRETPCVTQEYEEDSSKTQEHHAIGAEPLDHNKNNGLEDRLERVEALLQRLVDTGVTFSSPGIGHHNADPARPSQSIEEDVGDIFSTFPGALKKGAGYNQSHSHGSHAGFGGYGPGRTVRDPVEIEPGNYESISRKLYAALPSQHDADLIIAAGNTAPFLQFLCRPYEDIFRGEMLPASSLSAFPNSKSQPVLIARTLLYLAHGIQNLHPSSLDSTQLDLSCPLATVMQRFMGIACRLVTSNDEMLESLEGLECLILEGVFHINAGNLRRAWLVFRRAISLAQLTGLDRGGDADLTILDPATMASPSFMWHRIVSQDRYLALMLGLPPGTPDDCLGSLEDLTLNECPMGYLERIHCIIMSRITASRGSKSDSPASVDLRSIDLTLEKAARGMPPDWWQPPIKSPGDGEPLEDVLRIMFHITHFSLLIYLRLPHMLLDGENTQNSNKSTCVNASRELLNRYIRFRCMDSIAFCCTSIDFSAFTACLTLLLAHLRRWQNDNGVEDCLAHQRLSDRAMVQETIELMIELGQECGDTVLEKTTGIVSNLARIEADAAKKAGLYGGFSGASNRCAPNRSLRLMIPSFGIVSITRDGITPSASVTNSKGEDHSQKSQTREHPQQLSTPSAELSQDDQSRTLGASGVGFDMNMLQVPSLQNLGSQEGHALQLDQFQSQRGLAETSTANKSDFSFYFDQGMDEWPFEAAISLPKCTDEQHDIFSGILGSFSM
ncbi:hypothetical protein CDV31_003645 [Fusarium ambrosium]|uniref:Zn(2)-C6 fungal-type domain-containing protein n=1 Tax=Fusarium ambrosium TaxID=131363 RepID=A0A428UTI0_9HYPO|nr:hypothetical protein CDV31_003645 [Fusarium ambrosium]